MSDERREQVEKKVLNEVPQGTSITPNELILSVTKRYPDVSTAEVRGVVWHLVDTKALDLESNWRVRAR